jgi:hypothetical protein
VVTSGRERERGRDDDYMGRLVDMGGPTNGTHVVAALVTSSKAKRQVNRCLNSATCHPWLPTAQEKEGKGRLGKVGGENEAPCSRLKGFVVSM